MAVADWPRRPTPKREIRFAPRVGGGRPCLRSLKASRTTSPWRQFRLVPGYGVRRFRRACAIKRMAGAVSCVLPRKDKAIVMRVLSPFGGGPRRCDRGRLFLRWSTRFQACVATAWAASGIRRQPRTWGPLTDRRCCISQHVFAVSWRYGRLFSALQPTAPSMPTHRERR
jgi:hypothetical protein